MLSWLLLVAVAGAACPAEEVPAALVEADLAAAWDAYAAREVDAYVVAFSALETHVACADEVIPPGTAAGYLLLQGVHAALVGDPERATRSFQGARVADPAVGLPRAVAELGGEPVTLYASTGVPDVAREDLPALAGSTVYVNGAPTPDRPTGVPVVLQVRRDDGAITWTGRLAVGASLPDWLGRADADRGLLGAQGYRMVLVEPGRFEMGSPGRRWRSSDETPHPVTLTRPFRIGTTEVTQELWEAVTGENPSRYVVRGRPVEQVSWLDVVRFCNRLSTLEGLAPAYRIDGDDVTWDEEAQGYRLPTEAEWEYAARAGGTTRFSGSDGAGEVAWRGLAAGGRTHVVGQKAPNAWGLHDMTGNVWEWVWDRYGPYPTEAVDPTGPPDGDTRVYRGGAFNSSISDLRIQERKQAAPSVRQSNLGFRLARNG